MKNIQGYDFWWLCIGIVLVFLNMIFIWNTMQKIRSGVIEYMFLQITLFDDKLTSQDQIAVRYTLNGSVTIVHIASLQPHVVLC